MNNFIGFLEANNIEYEIVSYGNPNYSNDGFQVPADRISFNYELSDNSMELKKKEKKIQPYTGILFSMWMIIKNGKIIKQKYRLILKKY